MAHPANQSQSWKAELSGNLIQLLEKFEDLDKTDSVASALEEQAAIAGGERSLGDTQQGREVLELLQNGRDAIQKKQSDDRRQGFLYLGVSEEGVTVANTGEPFDFRKEKVRDAARITGDSAKQGDQIGKYGIGLTSIRSIGEAYEVLTRLGSEDNHRPDRVRFSPAAPLAGVHAATKTTENEPLRRFREKLTASEELQRYLRPSENDLYAELDEKAEDRIQNLPLFFYPVVLQIEDSSELDSKLAQRARQLLDGRHPEFDQVTGERPFTTAVTVDFEDRSWRELLRELNIDPTHKVAGSTHLDRPSPSQRAVQTWQYAAYDPESNTGLSPETLIHLGGIKRLYLERFENGESVERQVWEITEDSLDIGDNERLKTAETTVTISRATDPNTPLSVLDELRFDSFEWTSDTTPRREDHPGLATEVGDSDREEDKRVHPRILVPHTERTIEYAPHLFYPISGVNVRFPFCLHAEFLVETSRQNLHRDCIRHNATLLSLCAELLTEITTAIATESSAIHTPDHQGTPTPEILPSRVRDTLLTNTTDTTKSQQESPHNPYPWCLLPPVPDQETTLEPATQGTTENLSRNQPLELFCTTIYNSLATTSCLPTQGESSAAPSETFVHWDQTVNGAIAVLYELCFDEELAFPHSAGDYRLPTVGNVHSLLTHTLQSDWPTRIRQLLRSRRTSDTRTHQQNFLSAWADLLSQTIHLENLSEDPSEETKTITTDRGAAQILFTGTTRLISQVADEDSDITETISEFPVDGVCLLPCVRDEDADDAELVPVEGHEGGRSQQKNRIVRWIDRQQSEFELPAPPAKTTFPLYLLDERVVDQTQSILRAAGRSWGIGIAESRPDYYRAFLELIAATGSATRSDLLFLLKFFHDLDRSDSDDLHATEGSVHDHEYIQTFVTDEDRRPDFRPRLEVREADLAPSLHSGTQSVPLKSLYLSREWRQLRDDFEPPESSETVDASSRPDTEETEPASSYLDTAVTSPIPNLPQSARADASGGLASSLAEQMTILGASALPELEVLPLYHEAGPTEPATASWNPHDWDHINTALVESLKQTLEASALEHGLSGDKHGSGDYLDWISAPEFGPNTSAGHSDKCDVQHGRGRRGQVTDLDTFDELEIALSSWVWLPNNSQLADWGIKAVSELLSDHGDELASTVLATGWTCTQNHSRKFWQATVPTLLNWQFRHSTIWADAPWFDSNEWWNDGGESLAWAVVEQDSRATDLFPTVDIDTAPGPTHLWETLGVKQLGEVSPTEAAYRFQKLQAELATESLTGQNRCRLNDTYTKRGSGWKTAYTRLLAPIVGYLQADATTIHELPFLTHLPVLDADGHWVSVPITQLSGQVEYFNERQQKPWEERSGTTETWLLVWPSQGPLKPLATTLNAQRRAENKPTVPKDAVQESNEPNPEFVRALKENEALLLAIAARQKDSYSPDVLEELRETLAIAIEGLRPANTDLFGSDRLPGRGRSSVYPVTEDSEALVYDSTTTQAPADLASGLCLLFEQQQHLYFRTALEETDQIGILEDDIPIQRVRNFLDQVDTQRLHADLQRIIALVDTLTDGIEADPGQLIEQYQGDDLRQDLLSTITSDDQSTTSLPIKNDLVEAINDLTQPQQRVITTMLQREDIRPAVLAVESHRDAVLTWAVEQANQYLRTPLNDGPCRRLDALATAYQEATTDTSEARETVADWTTAADTYLSHSVSWDDRPVGLSCLTEDSSLLNDVWLAYDTNAFDSLCDRLIHHISGSPDGPLVAGLHRYVHDGDRPQQQSSETTRTETAKQRLQEIFDTVDPTQVLTDPGQIEPSPKTGTIQQRGSGGGGAIQSRTGRAEFAEQYVLAGVKQALNDWAAQDQLEAPSDTLWKMLETLENNDSPVNWHGSSRWEELFDRRDNQPRLEFHEWSDQHHKDTVIDRMLDITSERGPGYDILDPTGTLATGNSLSEVLAPHPIEVKAVQGDPPYRFQFTVNEFRRALAFVTHDAKEFEPGAYTILLVDVPSVETIDSAAATQLANTNIVRRIILDSPSKLFDWLPSFTDNDHDLTHRAVAESIAEVIKGGYLTVEIE